MGDPTAAARAVRAGRRQIRRGLDDPNPGTARLLPPPTLMDTTPTFTLGTVGASPTLTGTSYAYNDETVFRILGGRPISALLNGTTYYQNWANIHSNGLQAFTPTRWFKEFMFYGQAFETGIRAGATGAEFRVWVDGRPSHATPQGISFGSQSSRYYLKVDFGSVALRHVMIEVSVAALGALVVGPTDSVWRPDARYVGPTVVVLGDSFVAGANGVSSSNTWPNKVGELLGYRNTILAGEGGTSYSVQGSNSGAGADTYVARVTRDLIPMAPDIAIFFGGFNGSDASAEGAAAQSCFSTITVQLPNTKLFVVGPQYTTGSPTATAIQVRDAVRAQAATYADLYLELIGGPYPYSGNTAAYVGSGAITGSGRSGSTTGSGNADVFRGTDGTHPTQAGHDYYGHKVAQAIAAWIESEAV